MQVVFFGWCQLRFTAVVNVMDVWDQNLKKDAWLQQSHSRTFQTKKLSSRYNQKKLSTVEPHYRRALSKTSGVPCRTVEKSPIWVCLTLWNASRRLRCPTGDSSRGMWLARGGLAALPCRWGCAVAAMLIRRNKKQKYKTFDYNLSD
jgi:hypothetical protein